MAKARKNKEVQVKELPKALTRHGVVITIGDEVGTDWHHTCIGKVFIVETITPFELCESGFMIVAHLKTDPTRKLLGMKFEGVTKKIPDGLDSNWFKKC